MRVLIILLMAAAAPAQDTQGNRPTTVSIKGRTLREIAELLGKQASTKIEVAPEYADKVITLDMTATLADIVRAIAEKAGGAFHRDSDGTLHIVPAWQAAILGTLDTKQLRQLVWKKGDITLGGACQYLRAVSGLNLVLDDSLASDTGIVIEVDGKPVRALLDAMAKQADGAWRLRFGVIHLATADRLAKLPDRVAWQDDALLQRKFDVPFAHTRLGVVATYCKAATGVDIVFSPKAKEEAESVEVTLMAAKLTLAQVLALTLPPAGLKARVEGGVVKIEVAG